MAAYGYVSQKLPIAIYAAGIVQLQGYNYAFEKVPQLHWRQRVTGEDIRRRYSVRGYNLIETVNSDLYESTPMHFLTSQQ